MRSWLEHAGHSENRDPTASRRRSSLRRRTGACLAAAPPARHAQWHPSLHQPQARRRHCVQYVRVNFRTRCAAPRFLFRDRDSSYGTETFGPTGVGGPGLGGEHRPPAGFTLRIQANITLIDHAIGMLNADTAPRATRLPCLFNTVASPLFSVRYSSLRTPRCGV